MKRKIKVSEKTQIGKILSEAKCNGGVVSAFNFAPAFPIRSRMPDIKNKLGLLFTNTEKARKGCDVVLYRFPKTELDRVELV